MTSKPCIYIFLKAGYNKFRHKFFTYFAGFVLFLSKPHVNFCIKFEALKVSWPFEDVIPFPWNSAAVPKAKANRLY